MASAMMLLMMLLCETWGFVVEERERERLNWDLRFGVEAIGTDVVAGLEVAVAFFLELQRFRHVGMGGDICIVLYKVGWMEKRRRYKRV